MIVVFGGSGFLGARVVAELHEKGLPALGESPRPEIVIADVTPPNPEIAALDGVSFHQVDVTRPEEVEALIGERTSGVFHLAAVVSGTAEANFDLGMSINLFGALNILQACRRLDRRLPFLTTSSLAVFGPDAARVTTPATPLHPQSSYGAQKAIVEILCADFRRKGYVDARVLRLPTIAIRPGTPNGAASSFVSGIVREPVAGLPANCPVDPDLALWVASPERTVRNIAHAMSVPAADWPAHAVVDAPGVKTTPREMVGVLGALTSDATAALVSWEKDERIDGIVSTWPQSFDLTVANRLGFEADAGVEDLVSAFLLSQRRLRA